MADSCSNLKRSRTELLASISKPTCSGKFVSAWKLRISVAGLLSSTMRKSACFRSVTRLPCLSVTVNTTLTSLVPTRIFGRSPFSAPEWEFCSAELDGACKTWEGDGDCADGVDRDAAGEACAPPHSRMTNITSEIAAHFATEFFGNACIVKMPRMWLFIISATAPDSFLFSQGRSAILSVFHLPQKLAQFVGQLTFECNRHSGSGMPELQLGRMQKIPWQSDHCRLTLRLFWRSIHRIPHHW